MKAIDPKVSLVTLEQNTLDYWKKNKIFEKSVESRPIDKTWTFLDGPPFVTGMPHYGTLLSSLPKDLFGRYWTMKGYRVRRVWGWDGHGLPIENKVENKLEIKRKKDIEEVIGVKKFIEECRTYLTQMSAEWEWYVDHIGRWVDFKHAYKTWDLSYMESVMWVFKQMYEKGHIYKGLRVTLYCPHCSTPVSNFEVAMDAENHKNITETATTYMFELKDEPGTYLLAWSTTPWTKLGTTALAINPDLTYVKITQGDKKYILAAPTIERVIKDKFNEGQNEQFKGTELIGKEFIPHFDFYKKESDKKVGIVVGDSFVTSDEGTGVVTLAPYGQDDLRVMEREHIQEVLYVDDEGIITENVPKFGGMYYLKANKHIDEDLSQRTLIYKQEDYTHTMPHCWRCGTRLYYAPLDAWFVNVQKLKPLMQKTNEAVNWFPAHFKYGRFLKSLEAAPDWNISRNRYWGSPVPVWECKKCEERFVPGSIHELEEASGTSITDLHKPGIDEITVTCKKCGEKVHRVPEVLDSWIEAGSASFAERHFPFSNEKLEDFFPPDYIAEYTGQIRAWFYVLHVIGAALYSSPAFKNVSVTGVIMGTDGRKMSKNFKNYPDPKEMLEKYGGDALRLYLMGSPVMNGEDILISEDNYKLQVRGMMLILWNTYNFFVSYALADAWEPKVSSQKPVASPNVLDTWIVSLLHNLTKQVTSDLDSYNPVSAIAKLQDFVTDFSTWYIRRSRDRVGPSAEDKQDKEAFYNTCYTVLTTLCKLLAPITPFIAEEIYRNLTNAESVHLADWPEADKTLIHNGLEAEMKVAMRVASQINAYRKDKNIKAKIPIRKVTYNAPQELSDMVLSVVKDEGNVYELVFGNKSQDYTIEANADESNLDLVAGEAREIIRKIQQERKNLGTLLTDKVHVVLESWPEAFEEEIKKKALVESLEKGEFKVTKVS